MNRRKTTPDSFPDLLAEGSANHDSCTQGASMFEWLKRLAYNRMRDMAKRDFRTFLAALRGMSDREVAEMVVVVTSVRLSIQRDKSTTGTQLRMVLHQFPAPPDEMAQAAVTVVRLVQESQRTGRFEQAACLSVLLHSIRAFTFPDLRMLGRELWAELARGQAYLARAVELQVDGDPGLAVSVADLKDRGGDVAWVPSGLEPHP